MNQSINPQNSINTNNYNNVEYKTEYSINAYAKINLGLDVIRKRPDGYHDLKMIMQSIELHDTLEFRISDKTLNDTDNNISSSITSNNGIPDKNSSSAKATIRLTCSDPSLPCDDGNLIVKAARLFTEKFNINKTIDIHLTKNIPVAAGMAGGSTDGAAALIALNDIFSTHLSQEELMKLGVTLGADIPFCIMGGTALSEGIGDILTPLAPPADAVLLIAKPPIEVSTGFVYGNLKLDEDSCHPDIDRILEVLSSSAADTGRLLANILESVTIPAYPVIDDIKKCMMSNGALGSLMSGSGPTVFGLYENEAAAAKALTACKELCDNMYCVITRYHN